MPILTTHVVPPNNTLGTQKPRLTQITRKDKSMKKSSLAAAVLFCFVGSWLFAAEDKPATETQKPAEAQIKDAKKEKKSESKLAGRWEGKITRQDGEEMKLLFTFKVDGDKLTGTIESPRGELSIDEGKVKGEELSFNVDIGDNTIEYQGKLADNKIKMKSKGPWGEREMTLSRVVDINGKWVTKFEPPGGEEVEVIFTFKVEGDKLTGKVVSPMGELDIENGKVKGDTFTFDVALEDNTIGHECKISGDEIKMKLKGFGDESQPIPEFTLKRAKDK
jgi:hypothetical protein